MTVAATAVPGTASLPMYDLPEIRWATDALWSAVAARLVGRGRRGAAGPEPRPDGA